jgi:putative glycosyltransferase (TIGR04372 family)
VKKIFKKIKNEKYLVFLIPIALLFIPIILVIRNFIIIRFGLIHSDRIGHFASNTALYLKEKEKERGQKKKIDLLYLAPPISNKQLAKMWKRKLIVLPIFLIRPFWLIFRLFKIKGHLAGISENQNRDINNLLYNSKKILNFTKKEILYCRNILKKNKIDKRRIILLICRDDNYLKKRFGEGYHYHNYRNVEIETYRKTIKYLLSKNYHVIRMGKYLKKNLILKNDKYIELFNSQFHSDLMEIYLASICKFCITSSTGYDEVPKIFDRPILYTNVCPLSDIQANNKKFKIIFQKYIEKKKNKILTLSQIVQRNIHELYDSSEFKKHNIILKKNSSEEILQATKEIIYDLDGIKYKKDDKLQKKFWKTFRNEVALNSKTCQHNFFNAKISDFYLKKIEEIIK